MHSSSPTRVLIVAASPLFVRIFLRDQIRLLVSAGYDVLVVCSAEEGARTLEEELGCKVERIEIARTISLFRDVRSLWLLYRTALRWHPAMVHTHTPKAGLLGSLAAWLGRVPVRVHTIHGLRSETLRGMRGRIVEAMERLTSACSTDCVAVSASLRREVVQRGICKAGTVRVLGFGSAAGVALEHFRWSGHREKAMELRAVNGVGEQELLVTYLGRIAHDKGIHVLAAAWAIVRERCPGAKLLIAGPNDTTDPCDTSVLDALSRDERVLRYPGFVVDVAPVLAASDLFIQPSFREGLSVSALEAAAMRVPVIASRVTGLVDAVQDGRTGLLVKPNDSVALACKMEQLLNAPQLRKAMGKEALRFVERRFDRRVVLQHTLAFYRELLVPRVSRSIARHLVEATIAGSLLILLSPLLLTISLAVLLSMGRPVFFRQQRAGLAGKTFHLAKFRTMRPPSLHESTLGTDELRTAALGDWLRTLSLDELPQLWNILCGEMSLIGPRPLLVDYMPRYSEFERRRHEVRPGITGWAQVNGRNNMSWQQKFAMDVWYVDHRSLRLDMKIVWMTLQKLCQPKDIVPNGHSAMSEFLGSATPQQH